jgi:hypothetical protein
MSESLLSRWSRLKDEARRRDRGTRPSEGAGDGKARAPAAERELTGEEIAALPRLDELTADTDITAFLRRGVPPSLRNAALRKMWMLDPAIRDFVGHARDYDYDWNTPGGAPGHGALEPADDVARMVRRVFGESDRAVPGTSEAGQTRIVTADRPVPAEDPAAGKIKIEGDDHA